MAVSELERPAKPMGLCYYCGNVTSEGNATCRQHAKRHVRDESRHDEIHRFIPTEFMDYFDNQRDEGWAYAD